MQNQSIFCMKCTKIALYMIRIFLPPEELSSDELLITGDNARHLSLVLRVQPGDVITAFDGNGYKYECNVLHIHKREVKAKVISRTPCSVESGLSITLVQGMAKGEKMDLIVQKSTELGVRKIIPVITERSQVRSTHKVDRWRKIALSASQQSGRDRIPEVMEPEGFKEFLNNLPSQGFPGIIFSEEHTERNLKKILTDIKDVKNITLLIGPEGGFSKEEVTAAVEKGFMEVSLGTRILRTETAPIAALSIIQYELGDIG